MDNWEAETLNISGIVDDSIVDGPGLRYTIFVQGCPHGCPECHNPQTHDFAGGTDTPREQACNPWSTHVRDQGESTVVRGNFFRRRAFLPAGAAGDSWSADKEGRHASNVLQWLYV